MRIFAAPQNYYLEENYDIIEDMNILFWPLPVFWNTPNDGSVFVYT